MRIGVAIAPRDDKFLSAHRRCWILEDYFERVRYLNVVLDHIFTPEGAHGLGSIDAHRPMHDVDQMHAPVGECSSRIVPKGAKSADAAIAVVGVVRSGAKPKVPVQPGRWITVGRIAHAFRPTVAVNPCFGKGDLPDFSVLNQLHGLLKMFARALLRADLHHAVVFCRRLDHSAALGQRMRERLFDINILASFASHDHGDGVPVIRGGDDHRLYVLVVEDGAKILVPFGLPVGELKSPVQIGLERICDGDGNELAGQEKVDEVELTHSASADQAHANPLISRQHALRDRASRSDNAHGGSCQALVEVPSRYLKVSHFSHLPPYPFCEWPQPCVSPAVWYILARYAADREMKSKE